MNIAIRKYNKADYLQIDMIFNLSKKVEMSFSGIAKEILSISEDEKMKQLFEESEIILAEENNVIVGFAGVKGNLLSFFFIDPQYFQRGYGKKLLNFLVNNYFTLELFVLQENIPAIHLYKSFGFSVIQEFQGEYNGRKHNALKMKRELMLVPFSSEERFEDPFKAYILNWINQKTEFGEDYSKTYNEFLNNYQVEMQKYLQLNDERRLSDGKHIVWFYWLMDIDGSIVATIRYRENIPEEFGNIGFEVSPSHRNKGFGKLILRLLLDQLKKLNKKQVILTVVKENTSSIAVIEANKGIAQGKIYNDYFKSNLLKYRIEL